LSASFISTSPFVPFLAAADSGFAADFGLAVDAGLAADFGLSAVEDGLVFLDAGAFASSDSSAVRFCARQREEVSAEAGGKRSGESTQNDGVAPRMRNGQPCLGSQRLPPHILLTFVDAGLALLAGFFSVFASAAAGLAG
jgi:hypothetical protein